MDPDNLGAIGGKLGRSVKVGTRHQFGDGLGFSVYNDEGIDDSCWGILGMVFLDSNKNLGMERMEIEVGISEDVAR